MKRRYEIELHPYADGRVMATIYDDYWDSHMTAFSDPRSGVFHPACYETASEKTIQEITTLLPNPQQAGWYAVDVESYPFGTPVRAYRIPGRYQRYTTTR